MKSKLPLNLEIKGIGVSDGIAIGKAFVLTNERAVPFRREIRKETIKKEQEHFLCAINKTKAQLDVIKKNVLQNESLKEYANIIAAHIAMLQDKAIIDATLHFIEKDLINAEWAFNMVIEKFIKQFDKITDPYIKERKYDLEHLKDKVLKNLYGHSFNDPNAIKSDVILFAYDLSPADTARLNPNKIKGIVTEMGSMTSHTAIVAKALGIPAIVGAETLLSKVVGGDNVIIDGYHGIVIINPNLKKIEIYKNRKDQEEKNKQTINEIITKPSITKDNVHIILKANIEIAEEILLAKKNGSQGIGLYRTEFLFLNREKPPSEEEHYQIYSKIANEMYPHEVTIRTFDLGGDKLSYYHHKFMEKNPALGLRAIRFCLLEKKLFLDQIKGILRANTKKNVRILFPLISTVAEIRKIKKILKEAIRELDEKKVDFHRNIKIGVMIEVPSAALIADDLAKEVDFFSIGTNDLIQYTMAIDRSNEYVANLYDPLNPSILKLLNMIYEAANRNKISVNICGEMAGEPKYLSLLIGMGFREFSMNPNSLLLAKQAVLSLEVSSLENEWKKLRDTNFKGLKKFISNNKNYFLTS